MELRVKSEDAAAATNDSPSVTASPLPTSSDYNDFLLRSSAPQSSSSDPNGGGGGWKYNVMKFTAVGDRVIDPADESLFLRPVKLNRKDPRTVRRLTDEDRERHNKRALDRAAKAAGLDPNAMDVDTKPNVDGDGDNNGGEGTGAAEEKEELDPDLVGKGVDGTTTVQRRGPRGQFKKKFQRVYVASEEARRLKREEWQPWVLEDDEGRERWVGRLEGGAGEIGGSANKKGGENAGGAASDQGRIAPSTSTGNGSPASLDGWRPAAEASAAGGGGSAYVAFVFGDNGDEFKVVPINRWYRFNQGPKYLTLAEEEAEAEVRIASLSLQCVFNSFYSTDPARRTNSTHDSRNQRSTSGGKCGVEPHPSAHQLQTARRPVPALRVKPQEVVPPRLPLSDRGCSSARRSGPNRTQTTAAATSTISIVRGSGPSSLRRVEEEAALLVVVVGSAGGGDRRGGAGRIRTTTSLITRRTFRTTRKGLPRLMISPMRKRRASSR